MAKGIRSKIKKRFRTAKRQRVDAMLVKPRIAENHAKLQRVISGQDFRLKKPKNAFKYPDTAGAVFPQHEVMKPIDFRSQNLPMAGYAFKGNRRKYEGEEARQMEQLAQTSHPKMEVLAGGGAIDAKTGQRVSMQKAELQATAADASDPAAAAAARALCQGIQVAETGATSAEPALQAGTAAGANGVAGAALDGDAEMDTGTVASEEAAVGSAASGPSAAPQCSSAAEPTNEADHLRLPVLKDARRQARAAEHRPRAKAAKGGKKAKQDPKKATLKKSTAKAS